MGDTASDTDAAVAGLLLASPDAIILTGDDGRIVEFNAGAEAMFGWTRAEVLGERVGDVVVPLRMRAAHEAGMQRMRDGGAPRVIGKRAEMPGLRRTGEEFACELTLSQIKIGDTRFFAAILRDLSELRAALEAQRQSAEFLRSIADEQTSAILRYDGALRLSFANAAAMRFWGETAEEMLGRHFYDGMHPGSRAVIGALVAGLTPDAPSARTTQPKRSADGTLRWIDWTCRALFDETEGGGRTGLLFVGRDVTEQVAAEKARDLVEARFAAFVENAPVGMYLKDAKGRYVLANPEMANVFRRPVEEVIGLGASDLLPEALVAVIEDADAAVRRSGQQSAIEEHLPGAERYEWTLVVRFPIGHGPETMIGGFDIDITPIKRAESEVARARAALFQTEKLNALGAFAAGVVHELNNPLTILMGQAEMLAEETEGSPLAERAAMIERVVQRCGQIARSFLSVARPAPSQKVPLHLPDVVAAAIEVAAYTLRGADIAISESHVEALPEVEGDPDSLHQVLLNLVLNAQQAMTTVDGPRRLVIETQAGEDGRSVVLEVSDTGPGVPAEMVEKVFDPLYTTKAGAGGTGLGLAISRTAIEAHGGTLTLEPSEHGARFRITLPAARP